MGACLSMGAPAHVLDKNDGDEEAYHQRYIEDQILGQGEFGVVKMVHDMRSKEQVPQPLACKTLKKGAVFKDNTLYSPMKPEILKGEIEILRALGGEKYCLKLVSVFETPKVLLVVTEFCGGGEMMEYISKQTDDLRTEDVSRISFQLLSALDHCSKYRVIHRDIKAENVMFRDSSPGSQLRLIDFGSGTMDPPERPADELHTTYAGSAFYTSPELFQKTYNFKTDVWSAGVAIYVLVAGYPSDCLQKAFNIIQKGKGRQLSDLPNLPRDMPDSFYELLEGALKYHFKRRPSAGELLENEFVQFHLKHEGLSIAEISAAASAPNAPEVGSMGRKTASLSVRGSVSRHTAFIGFKKFERSLTTIMATMLSKGEFSSLLSILKTRIEAISQSNDSTDTIAPATAPKGDKPQMLHVIKVHELKEIIRNEIKSSTVVERMEKLPNEASYGSFAYNMSLLRDFSSDGDGLGIDSAGRKRLKRRGSLKRTNSTGRASGSRSNIVLNDDSVRSAQSVRGNGFFSSINTTANQQPSSVHGSNVFGKRSSVA